MIYSIQRYCIHDGDGIRTVVFFKGCQLKCGWCANPESQKQECEIGFYANKCIVCHACESICRYNAIDLSNPNHIQYDLCNACGDCVYICPAEAYQTFGQEMTCESLVREVMKDWRIYKKSGGGVTVSGGEPTLMGDFLIEFLLALKKEGLHTAIETHGYINADFLERLVPLVDQFLFDVKHMDNEKHKIGTGVGNELIQKNLKKLVVEYKAAVIMRIPLIPDYNDDDLNMERSAKLAKALGLKVHLLAFHKMARGKYEAIQRNYEYALKNPQDSSRLKKILEIFQSYGVEAQIGG